jgi:hypothetical protein
VSTILYAELSNKRDEASAGMSVSKQPPGLKTYVDALAALIPAEILTLHALMLAATTATKDGVTTIVDAKTLALAFYGLLALSLGLYVGARWLAKKWDGLDWFRMLIPPCAFVGWTMLQRTTAFDAVVSGVSDGQRTVAALFLAAVLGFVAAALAYKADQNAPK